MYAGGEGAGGSSRPAADSRGDGGANCGTWNVSRGRTPASRVPGNCLGASASASNLDTSTRSGEPGVGGGGTTAAVGIEDASDERLTNTSASKADTRRRSGEDGLARRSSTVPGEEEFLGKGVSYCATCDAAFLRNKKVLVAGSTEEAAEEALYLSRFAAEVVLASPKPEPTLAAELQGKVRLLGGHRLSRVEGNGRVASAVVSRAGVEERLPVDAVFIYGQGSKPIADYVDSGVSVPWHRMNHMMGCTAIWSKETRDRWYTRLQAPEGRHYLMGDQISYHPGWQEGALSSAHYALADIDKRVQTELRGESVNA